MDLRSIRAFDVCRIGSCVLKCLSFIVVLVIGYFVIINIPSHYDVRLRHRMNDKLPRDVLEDVAPKLEFKINVSRLAFYIDSASEKIQDLVSKTNDTEMGRFAARVKGRNLFAYFKLVEDFVEVMETNGFTYMMYGGTLLGSYRHHGFIPWDDDLDFWVSAEQMDNFTTILQNKSFDVIPTITNYTRVRKPSLDGEFDETVQNITSRWPYLHVMFFVDNGTHVWDLSPKWDMVKYKRSEVFPLYRRPYENILLPAPRDSLACLRKYYVTDVCYSNTFSHMRGEAVRNYSMLACSLLYDFYPFVFRFGTGPNFVEKLVYQDKVLSSYQYYLIDPS